MLTHTPFVYVIFAVVVAGTLYWRRQRVTLDYLAIFVSGALSHILVDSIGAQTMLLYPLTKHFFGLADLNIAFFNDNLLFWNFLLEGILVFLFFSLLVALYVHRRVWRWNLFGAAVALLMIGVVLLIVGTTRVYHTPFTNNYDDLDQDGVINSEDRDLDGDGIFNMADVDADGDGAINELEIMDNAERFEGVWYDPFYGGLIQIPSRLGLVINSDIPRRLYEAVGIYLRVEMTADYRQHPQDYALPPTSSRFDNNADNLKVWLAHQNVLEDLRVTVGESRDQIGDILFFESGYIAVVTGFNNRGQAVIVDASSQRSVGERLAEEVGQWEGAVLYRGKVISKINHPQQNNS